MPEWDAEIDVDEALARTLIAGRFPHLDVASLRRIGEGWDNTVWAIDGDLAFRFPRRQIAIPGVEREIALLPTLAPRLPAQIPDAAYVGAPCAGFPWPWFGSRMIAGTEIARSGLHAGERGRLASELGAFLGRLHALRGVGVDSLAVDPLGRAEMSTRVPRARTALGLVTGLWDGDRRAHEILDAAEDLAPDADVVLVHGDLNLRHALVSASGGLAGVIDWGDMCRAPRSVDLALYWSLFGTGDRAAFRAAYGPLPAPTLLRARVLALFFDATLAVYAAHLGMDDLQQATLDGLRRTVVP